MKIDGLKQSLKITGKIISQMRLLNLGCGARYHHAWVNVVVPDLEQIARLCLDLR
jgi:hypothetical protein